MDNALPISDILTAATMTADNEADLHLAPDVVLLKVWDGSSRLLDLGGQFFGLPVDSTRLLEAILRHGPREAACRIARQYGIPQERVQHDVQSFLHDLRRKRLVIPRRRRLGWCRFGARIIPRLLSAGICFTLRAVRCEQYRVRALLALMHLACRLLGWAETVRLCRAVTDSNTARRECDRKDRAVERIDQTVREAVARHLLPVDCKARALCCWTLLRAAGLPARLIVGIDLFPFLGHCWCESGTHAVADLADRSARFQPVLQYT